MCKNRNRTNRCAIPSAHDEWHLSLSARPGAGALRRPRGGAALRKRRDARRERTPSERPTAQRSEQHREAFNPYPTFRSIASQISAAMSAPPNALTWRMPVGEVTLISVR